MAMVPGLYFLLFTKNNIQYNMIRPLRIEYPGALYHVMSHGTGILWLYKDTNNFKNFIELLEKVKFKYGFVFHTFILMKNHYHILLETPMGNLSRGMLYFNRELARAYNRYHKRSGAVLKARYKAILIERESYYKNVFRYINQNATRKLLVKKVQDYKGGPWYYLNSKGTEILSEKIMKTISWDSLQDFLGFTDVNKVLNWLNEKEEPSFRDDQNYKYFLGSAIWVNAIRDKYIQDSLITKDIEEAGKLRRDNSNIWKMFKELRKHKEHKRYKDIVIYLLNKYCDMTQSEIAIKVGIKNGNAVGQRLYKFKRRLRLDNDLAQEVMGIENEKSKK